MDGKTQKSLKTEDDESSTSLLSSAACCIRFHWMNEKPSLQHHKESVNENIQDEKQISIEVETIHHTEKKNKGDFFRPVFTHQVFENEHIKGYEPKETIQDTGKVQEELNGIQMNKKVHSSFQYHVDAKHKLDISISLAPSCLFSRIDDILIEQKPMEKKKKRKVSFISSEEKAEKDSKPRLSVKEIKTALQKALPPPLVSSSESNDDTLCEKSLYLSEPIGTVINEYKRKETTTQDDGIESKYLLTLADGNCPKTTEYHNKIQKLSYWFIETAEEVDISSSENGFWKVAYLYEEKIDSSSSYSRYNLLGYITLFFFFAPFKKPRGGYVSRICQCLIFPTYQRKGHGAWMLESLYKYFSCATSKEKDVVEINVEDPAPSFVALRDKVDLRFFLESIVEPKDVNCSSSSVSLWDEKNSEYTPLTDAKAIQLGSQLKLTHRQVQRCYEMWKLMSLNEKEEESENEMKQFRIMVKKRLLKVYMEDLGALKTKEEQKQFLAEEFEKLLAHYQKIIQSCKKRS